MKNNRFYVLKTTHTTWRSRIVCERDNFIEDLGIRKRVLRIADGPEIWRHLRCFRRCGLEEIGQTIDRLFGHQCSSTQQTKEAFRAPYGGLKRPDIY
jgi:hypothetical protein